MDYNQALTSLAGGALIGLAATALLLFNGRVTGISGIISSSLRRPSREDLWRWMFLIGLFVGGLIMNVLRPDLFGQSASRTNLATLLGGLLVGYGTVMGSGCTSGHGVCGLSRFSVRSFIATLTFMLFGFLTVQVVSLIFGGSL